MVSCETSQGLAPEQIAPNQDAARFWSTLLELEVEPEFLSARLNETKKEECLGPLKVRAIPTSCESSRSTKTSCVVVNLEWYYTCMFALCNYGVYG